MIEGPISLASTLSSVVPYVIPAIVTSQTSEGQDSCSSEASDPLFTGLPLRGVFSETHIHRIGSLRIRTRESASYIPDWHRSLPQDVGVVHIYSKLELFARATMPVLQYSLTPAGSVGSQERGFRRERIKFLTSPSASCPSSQERSRPRVSRFPHLHSNSVRSSEIQSSSSPSSISLWPHFLHLRMILPE